MSFTKYSKDYNNKAKERKRKEAFSPLNPSETLCDERPQPRVFERRRHPLLVGQLPVDVLLLRVLPFRYRHVHFKPFGQGLRQPHAQAQADQRRHGAVRDGRGERQRDGARRVVDGDGGLGDDAQLLERVGVLRVCDGADVVEDLAGVDGLAGRVGVGEGGRGLESFFFFFFFFFVCVGLRRG